MAEIVVKLVNGELAGKTAQTIAKEVNAAALALKKAEIGTKEWVAANQKLETVKQTQADLKKQLEGTATASDLLKKSWNSLPGAQFFNQIGSSIGMAKSGVGGLVSQFGVLKTAIAATGIGALVLIFTSLYSWFKKTDEGATKLDGIFRAIGNSVDVILNRLINLKDSLFQLFTNPGKFFTGLIADIKEGIDVGQELADTFDELDQARRDMELADAKQTNQIQKLLLQSKNVALSYKERLEILDQVDKLEQENYQTKLKYAQDYSAAVDKETNQMIKSGTISDEQLDKQNEARIKMLEVQGESIVLQEKIENRRSQLLEKQQAERERDIAKQEKENEQLLKQQEKFNNDKTALQVKFDLMNDNRMAANAEKEKKRIMEGMAIAAKAIDDKIILNEKEAANVRALQDLKRAAHNEQINLFNEGINSLVAFLGADEAARKKNANAIKAFTIGQIAVNLQNEIQAIWETANASPTNILFPGSGNLIAGLKTAFAVVRAGAAVRRVSSQKFEYGGMIHGPGHAWGGVPMPEAEGGEFIFSRKAVAGIGANTLASLNNFYTRKFATGGPVTPFQSSKSSAPSNSASDPFSAINDLKNTFMMYADEMSKRIDRIQVHNNVQDTAKGIQVVNGIKREADV